MLELYRRVALAVCLAGALWLYFLADLTPFFSLRQPKAPEAPRTHNAESLLAAPRVVPPPTVITVDGAEWPPFLAKALAVSRGQDTDPDWLRRVPAFERTWDRPREVYFQADEPPMRDIEARLPLAPDTLLVPAGQDGPTLAVRYTRLSDDDFHLGSGLSEYGPPRALVFPWRWLWPWCLGLGLLAYLLPPWPRFARGERHFARWRVCLGDFGWAFMFAIFFGLPMAIVGGSVQALAAYPVFPMVLWPLAGLALLLVWFTAFSASLRIRLSQKALVIGALGPPLTIPLSDIVRAAPVMHRYPKWFIRLMWIAALFGKGAGRLQAAGQALMLEGSRVSGLALTLKNGATAYIWLTDALGGMAVIGGRELVAALEKAGVPLADRPRELVRLFPPMLLEDRRPHRRHLPALIGAAIVLGPALLSLAAWLVRG